GRPHTSCRRPARSHATRHTHATSRATTARHHSPPALTSADALAVSPSASVGPSAGPDVSVEPAVELPRRPPPERLPVVRARFGGSPPLVVGEVCGLSGDVEELLPADGRSPPSGALHGPRPAPTANPGPREPRSTRGPPPTPGPSAP